MELNEYQERAMQTCMATSNNFSYMILNLVGEVGEFTSKVAKGIRHGQYRVISNQLQTAEMPRDPEVMEEYAAMEDELKKEMGDILWQCAGLCHCMGWDLEDIAQGNLYKLASRQKRNVIDGNGDNR